MKVFAINSRWFSDCNCKSVDETRETLETSFGQKCCYANGIYKEEPSCLTRPFVFVPWWVTRQKHILLRFRSYAKKPTRSLTESSIYHDGLHRPPPKILDSKTSSLDPNLLHNQSSQLRLAVSNERWTWTGTLPMLPSQCFLLFFGAFFLFAGMSVILCLQVFLLLSADLLSVHQIIYQIHRDQKLERLSW